MDYSILSGTAVSVIDSSDLCVTGVASCSDKSFPLIESKEYPDDCKKVIKLNAAGYGEEDLHIYTKWYNKNKTLKLFVCDLKDDKKQYSLDINYKVYEKYKVEVKNGIVTITLFEIINEKPKFDRVF